MRLQKMLRYYFGGERIWNEVEEKLNEKLRSEKIVFEREKFIARKLQQHENELIYKADYFNKVRVDWVA